MSSQDKFGLWGKLEEARREPQVQDETTSVSATGKQLSPLPRMPAHRDMAASGAELDLAVLGSGTVVTTNNSPPPPPPSPGEHAYIPPSMRTKRASPANYRRVGRPISRASL